MLLWAAAAGDRSLADYFGLPAWKRMMGIWLMPLFLWIAWLGLAVTYRRIDRPAAAMVRIIRRHRHWLLRGLLFCVLLRPLASAFTVAKTSIPDFVPFYADPALAYADRLLFFGTDPWRLTHAVFGGFETMLLDRLYMSWFFMMMGLLAWFCFTRNQRLQVRGLLSYALTWLLLGSLMALAMSSVGPCFYELYYGSDRFTPLVDTMRAYDQQYWLAAYQTMDWLYRNGAEETLGGGISAMPSMHIGISFLFFLTVRSVTKRRRLVWLAGAYVVAMWVASVHLGWHYAIDGPVAVAGVAAIWWATGRFVAWLERPREPVPSYADDGAAAKAI